MSELINFFNNYEKNNKIEGRLTYDHSLAKSSWFGVGGNAEVFYICDSKKQLIEILSNLPQKFNRSIIGQGSNILIRDGGIKGLVIKLGKTFQNIVNKNNTIIVGGATLDKVIARYGEKKSLGGLEFLSGIPGNIGGALAMNAGCFGSEISNIFLSANGVDYFGNIIKIAKEDFNFEYRYNPLALNSIFTEIILSAENDDQKSISSKIEKINIERTLSQPKGIKTGGSTFKNPDVTISKKKAWELIRETKNHELSFDGVSFSKKHSNFIENKQNKSANIIEDFCKLVKSNIFEKTGIELNLEIKIMGTR
jgi:UDP-N-acetylmuramate dehydrogenase